MTQNKDNFIKVLVEDLKPVSPLPSGWVQALYWFISAIAVITVMVLVHGARFDLGQKLSDAYFIFESTGLVLLAIIVAYAGFRIGVPDARGRHKAWVSLIYGSLLFWIALLSYNAYTGLSGVDHYAYLHFNQGGFCSMLIIASAIASAGVMFFMLRGSFALRPMLTGLAVGIAASTIAYVGGMYFCSMEGGLHIVIWHMVPVLGMSLLLAFLGQGILRR